MLANRKINLSYFGFLMAVILQGLAVRSETLTEKLLDYLSNTKNSTSTLLMLQKDDVTGAQLDYGYFTMEQTNKENNTKDYYLVGEITLRDLPTQLLYENYDKDDEAKKPNIRISIGWRNPQEDAYDITSIMINYTADGTISAECIDGYSNGSISTKLYNPSTVEPFYTQKWDGYNIYNITMKEWTDNVNKVDYQDTKYIPMQFR